MSRLLKGWPNKPRTGGHCRLFPRMLEELSPKQNTERTKLPNKASGTDHLTPRILKNSALTKQVGQTISPQGILKELNPNKASGPDHLIPRITERTQPYLKQNTERTINLTSKWDEPSHPKNTERTQALTKQVGRDHLTPRILKELNPIKQVVGPSKPPKNTKKNSTLTKQVEARPSHPKEY
ncbi:unnamed protein product [Mytilus edulis]|uniref:Uncharacterized protein n=1 Tax=Mytilus edulis TaxID=6550 RepID=A0A8S3PW09_MYTED|nr:unnamed protein product [Mytilus edulis]